MVPTGSLTSEVIALLIYLMPGFLASWIFYGLTSFQKPNQFERVIQALIFTLIIQVAVLLIEYLFGDWGEKSDLFASFCVAVLIGLVFAYLANTDHLHSLARKVALAKKHRTLLNGSVNSQVGQPMLFYTLKTEEGYMVGQKNGLLILKMAIFRLIMHLG